MAQLRSNVRDREDSVVRAAEAEHHAAWDAQDAALNAADIAEVGIERHHPKAHDRPSLWSVVPEGSIPPPPSAAVEPTPLEARAIERVEEAIAEKVADFQSKVASGVPYGGDHRGFALPPTPDSIRGEAIRLASQEHATEWGRYLAYQARRDAWFTTRDRHVAAHRGQRNDHAELHRALGVRLPDDPTYRFGVGEIHTHRPDGTVLYIRAGLNEPDRTPKSDRERIAELEERLDELLGV